MEGLPSSFGKDDEVETLQIFCVDPILHIQVILMYSVFMKVDIITRSVKIVNHGKQILKLEKALSVCLNMDNQDFEMISLHGSWGSVRNALCLFRKFYWSGGIVSV